MKIYNIEGKKRSSLVYTQFETDRNEIELFKIDERSTVKAQRLKFDEGSKAVYSKIICDHSQATSSSFSICI